MNLDCTNCGASLTIGENQNRVTCPYCQQVMSMPGPAPQSAPPPRRGVAPRPSAPPAAMRMVILVAVVGMLVSGMVVAFVALAPSRVSTAPAPATPAPQAADRLRQAAAAEREALARSRRAEAEAEAEAAGAASVQIATIDAAPAAAQPRPAKRARAKTPEYTGPILSKADAEKALEPELLSCMRHAGTYYLITRLGNDRHGSSVPPLHLTGISVVDYVPTAGFAETPLGKCVARAGRAVRAPAYRGNYIYFGLHNDAVADPLAGAPREVNDAKAKQAMSALDGEARDCATSHPKGSRPGERTTVVATFQGATGRVSKVQVLYVDRKSPYARCIIGVYRKASTEQFKRIQSPVTYELKP